MSPQNPIAITPLDALAISTKYEHPLGLPNYDEVWAHFHSPKGPDDIINLFSRIAQIVENVRENLLRYKSTDPMHHSALQAHSYLYQTLVCLRDIERAQKKAEDMLTKYGPIYWEADSQLRAVKEKIVQFDGIMQNRPQEGQSFMYQRHALVLHEMTFAKKLYKILTRTDYLIKAVKFSAGYTADLKVALEDIYRQFEEELDKAVPEDKEMPDVKEDGARSDYQAEEGGADYDYDEELQFRAHDNIVYGNDDSFEPKDIPVVQEESIRPDCLTGKGGAEYDDNDELELRAHDAIVYGNKDTVEFKETPVVRNNGTRSDYRAKKGGAEYDVNEESKINEADHNMTRRRQELERAMARQEEVLRSKEEEAIEEERSRNDLYDSAIYDSDTKSKDNKQLELDADQHTVPNTESPKAIQPTTIQISRTERATPPKDLGKSWEELAEELESIPSFPPSTPSVASPPSPPAQAPDPRAEMLKKAWAELAAELESIPSFPPSTRSAASESSPLERSEESEKIKRNWAAQADKLDPRPPYSSSTPSTPASPATQTDPTSAESQSGSSKLPEKEVCYNINGVKLFHWRVPTPDASTRLEEKNLSAQQAELVRRSSWRGEAGLSNSGRRSTSRSDGSTYGPPTESERLRKSLYKDNPIWDW